MACLCLCLSLQAQTPERVRAEGSPIVPGTLTSATACAPGQAPMAGTSTQSLGLGSQSINLQFLCFGDTLFIDHNGDFDLSGDPQPATAPGIVYGLYRCAPVTSGPDLNTIIQTDNCLIDFDPANNTTLQAMPTTDFNAQGDGFFINEGGFQTIFNMGDPLEMFFTPITVDDFIPGNPGWEPPLTGGDAGPCVHANIDDDFSIVLLNEILLTNFNDNAGGNGCSGSAIITGGLPEYQLSNYTIDVFLTSDPTIEGHSANATNTQHNEIYVFDVPFSGEYTIEIRDDMGCRSSSFNVMMNSCTPVTLEAGDSIAPPNTNFCLPITVQEFNDIISLQQVISWDASIMTFTTAFTDIPDASISWGPAPANITDSIIMNVFHNFGLPLTIPDGAVAFELCFDMIGPVGSIGDIVFEDNGNTEIVGTGAPNSRIAYIFNDGSILISDGTLLIDVTTICASPTSPVEGGFNFIVSGGEAPYDYMYQQNGGPTMGDGTIMDEGGLASITMLPPGDYTITVTDNLGIVSSTMITIVQTSSNYGAQLDEENPTCATDMDGSVTINISGGVSPYTVVWDNGITNMNVMNSDTISNLTVGNYAARVTDANGCEVGPFSTSLIVSAVSVDSISLRHVSCIGEGMDGSIMVDGAGGIGPYSFIWNDGSTTETIDNLSPGTYCVTVSDNNMCLADQCFEVLPPNEPTIDGFDVTQIECPNDQTGALTVNVTPGNTDIIDIAWNTGDNGPTIENLSPGDYIVTITDLDGCMDTSMFSLITPDEIMVISTPTEPTCPDDMDGQIQLMISGATMPYSILWEDGSSLNPRLALACDSMYFVTITGANECDTIRDSIFVDCPPPIRVDFSQVMDVDCFNGSCNGEALATASGGTSTSGLYNYQWMNGETDMGTIDSRAVQLCRGWNQVTINDNACAIIDSVLIGSPTEIELSPDNNTDDPSCLGGSDGMITIAASGGTPGYTYLWQDGTTGPTITGLPADIYNVTITDANMCEEIKNITLGEPDLFQVLIDSTQLQQVLCPGDSTGVIVVFPTGGNPGIIDYQWTDNVSTSSVGINLKSGIYSVTATDPKGCTDDILVTLSQPDPIVFDIGEIVEPQCFGFQTVVTIDTALGGNGPLYEFSVNNGPKRPIQSAIPVLGGQSALITVFDRSGCEAEEMIVINQPAELLVDLGADIEIQLGDTAIINPFIGSTLPVDSLVWQPLNALMCEDSMFCLEVVVDPLETQTYTLTAFDINGCSGTDEIIVDVDKNRNVFVPNVFSPNGDGNNDRFKPFIGPGVENINSFQVFDRWGEVLFSRSGKYIPGDLDQTGWDGTLNGRQMNPGVYIYLIEVEFVDGQVLLYRGDVTLLY